MINGWKGAIGAAMALAPSPGAAQDTGDAALRASPEITIGLLAHGIRRPGRSLPPGYDLYESEEERGTADLQLGFRSARLAPLLRPRLTARLQLNTAGRTSFASVGAEWRQHVLRGRLYGQIGIGLAVHDGYLHALDPFAPGISEAEARRRYRRYSRHTAFGSRVLFHPNLSVGVRLSERLAIEVAFEHFSHRQVFDEQNPGINMAGVRLVRALGRP